MPGDFSVQKTDSVNNQSYIKELAKVNAKLDSINNSMNSVFVAGKKVDEGQPIVWNGQLVNSKTFKQIDEKTLKEKEKLTEEQEKLNEAIKNEAKKEVPKYEAEPKKIALDAEQKRIESAEQDPIKNEAPKFIAEP